MHIPRCGRGSSLQGGANIFSGSKGLRNEFQGDRNGMSQIDPATAVLSSLLVVICNPAEGQGLGPLPRTQAARDDQCPEAKGAGAPSSSAGPRCKLSNT